MVDDKKKAQKMYMLIMVNAQYAHTVGGDDQNREPTNVSLNTESCII